MKKYVINLDRREDRMRDFESRYKKAFGRADFERFSAVDGEASFRRGLSAGEEWLYKKLGKRERENMAGVFGCWYSHVLLWEMLAESKTDDVFIIFEDDAFFSGDASRVLTEVMESMDTKSMDIVYIGGRFGKNFWPKRRDNWESMGIFYKAKSTRPNADVDRTTHAYILTKKGAFSLLDSLSVSKGSLTAVDDWINLKRLSMDVFDIFPHIAYSPIGYESDIRPPRRRLGRGK